MKDPQPAQEDEDSADDESALGLRPSEALRRVLGWKAGVDEQPRVSLA
jgi:hypothetical protein